MKNRIAVISVTFIALLAGLVTTPTWALTATEVQKLLASDGATDDNFGWSVAMDGDTAVIGASGADAAYVFVRNGTGWSQQAKLAASDGERGDRFGWRVALDGDTAVIGAVNSDGNVVETGAAYVFVRSGTGWSQQAKLIASDGATDDSFGWSVAVDGETAVIGGPFGDGNVVDSGAAYVFVRNGTGWSQQAKLAASDGANSVRFGWSVAVDGDTAVIGDSFGDGNVVDSGAAYVFVRNGTGWSQQAKLIASDGEADDKLGSSVAVDGDTAVIGAVNSDGNVVDSGAAYVFVRNGTGWSQQAKLAASDGANFAFGISVAVDGDTAVIGDWLGDGNVVETGAAYVFVRSGTGWSQQAKLIASDGADGDQFGLSVAVDGDTAVIGAVNSDGNASNSGAAYVFSLVSPMGGSVGGTVTGMLPQTISCENKETRQRVSVPLSDDGAWDCEEAGLVFDTGDRITQRVTGTADGTASVGGTVTGVSGITARCDNVSRGRSVVIDLNGGNTWDCEEAGLRVRTGDSIIQFVTGTADATTPPDIQTVSIDIKPGDDSNRINLVKDTAVSVAILTDSGFDALAVDPSSVRFGADEGSAFVYRSEDSDGDGDIDLRLRFRLNETGIACGDAEATLAGVTFDGQQITGTDSIEVICN